MITLVFGLLFLPTPQKFAFNGFHVFPFNFPAWSLCWELVANAIYAVLARVLTRALLTSIIVAGALMLIAAVVLYGNLDGGSNFGTIYSAPLRVIYSFFTGVAVFRVWQSGRFSRIGMHPAISAVLLVVTFSLPVPASARGIYDLVVVMAIYPALILAATREPSRRFIPFFTALGLVSYPLYALHGAFQRFEMYAAKLLQSHAPLGVPLLEVGFIICMSVLAAQIEWRVDRPIRRWLLERLKRKPIYR